MSEKYPPKRTSPENRAWGRIGSTFLEAIKDKRGSETRRIGLHWRLFGFQNRNPGHCLQVRKTETSKKILLLFGSLLLMLLFAEGTLRLFPKFRPLPRTYVGEYDNRQAKYWWVPDPLVGWKMRRDLLKSTPRDFEYHLISIQANPVKGLRSPVIPSHSAWGSDPKKHLPH